MTDIPVVPPGGKHLIVELWSGMTDFLQSTKWTREICFAAAKAAGATIIADHFHHFGGQHGVSGTVILAESHISIHTWPETGYASIDVFMCGQCDPLKTVETFVEGFCANKTQFKLIDRPSQQIVVDKKIERAYIYSNS